MIKKIIFLVIILSANSFLFSAFGQKKVLSKIIIDPGHGGDFTGAKGTVSTEANVALAVSLKLGKAIEQEFPETKVLYTRTTDNNAGNKSSLKEDLRYRADFANASGGDLFIAIHCNSAGKKAGGWYAQRVVGHETKYRMVKKGKKTYKKKYSAPIYETYWVDNLVQGTETYIWALSKNDAKVNSVANNNEYYGEIDSTSNITLPDPTDPAEKARMLIYAQNYFRKSLLFADMIEKGFQSQGRVYRGGVKQRNDKGIWVLQATGMPSVLVEIGFISNKDEEEYINSEKGQDEIVANIIASLKEYKQKLESKQLSTEQKAF
jgi:N-acetylmuramoyl-L-alanine amidase